jgi:hypothetical protein
MTGCAIAGREDKTAMLGVAFSVQAGVASRKKYLRRCDDPNSGCANKTNSHQRKEQSKEGHSGLPIGPALGGIMGTV